MSGELPGHWNDPPLGSLVRDGKPICYGVLKPGDYHPSGVPLIRIVDLEGDRIDERGLFRIGMALDAEFARSRLDGGEVLLSIQGTVGRVAIASERLRGANISRTIARIDIAEESSAEFVRHWMLSARGQRAFDDTIVGTTRSSLNIGALRKIRVPLPPLSEQRRIAEILDTLDEVIRKTEQVIAKLQQMKQGLLHDLLTRGIDEHGELRDPDRHPEQFKDSPLGRIPRGWEVEPVEELCAAIADCPHSTPAYQERGIPCIRTADIVPGRLLIEQARRVTEATYEKRTARLNVTEGDIIYSREGERLGIAAPVGPERVCMGQRVMQLRPATSVDPTFLVWAMNGFSFYRQVLQVVGSTTSPHVNIRDIRGFWVARPSAEEQARIGTMLRALEGKAQSEQANSDKLRTLKHGLMDDLLTGRVRVSVPEEVNP